MKNWKVTSNNRSAGKRLLNAWHDSRLVRTWTLAQLDAALVRAVNDGLMTHEGIARALNVERDAPRNDARGNGDGRDNGVDEKLRDERDDNSGGNNGGDGDGDDNVEPVEQKKYEQALDAARKAGRNDAVTNLPRDDEKYDMPDLQNAYEQGYAEGMDGTGDDNNGDDNDNGDDDNDAGDDDVEQQRDDSDIVPCDDCGKPTPQKELSVRNRDGLAVCPDCDECQCENCDATIKIKDALQHDDKTVCADCLALLSWDGHHEMYDVVMKYIAAGLNVALVGPAGTGKSFLAHQVADALSLNFYCNGALMSKYDLIGYCDAHGEYHATPAYEAFTKGGLHCFDELDASAPEAVVAFNGMTDDQPVYTFPCGQREQHADYVAIACMNTYGNGASSDYVGRFKQDAASMDRFVRVFIDYDKNVERAIAGKHVEILERVWSIREACSTLGIRHIVSMRMIKKASKARDAGVTKKQIERDIFFAGLDDGAVAQIKAQMRNAS